MTSALAFSYEAFGIAIAAGVLGSLLGIGGGIIVVPGLTLLLGVDIRFAIGASIVSVIASSSGAALTYVRKEIAHVKLAMLLEVATVVGALLGAFAVGWLSPGLLYLLFGVLLFYVAAQMLFKKSSETGVGTPSPQDLSYAQYFGLAGSYQDFHRGEVAYVVRKLPLGMSASLGAGMLSGLLGIGGGIIKVPVMNLVMGVPLKVATATSNLMIGVTASASALVYFLRGDINPFIAVPVALGVLLGAQAGSRLLGHIQSHYIKRAFVGILLWVGAQMIWKWWDSSHGG